MGIEAVPYTCTFIVKQTNVVPTRAKSCIVVLGNNDPPVVPISMICFLKALAVQHGRTLKQGDSKFVFIQATIVKLPIGCPFSQQNVYWKLKKNTVWIKMRSNSLV